MGLSEAQKRRTGLGSIPAQSLKDEVGVVICEEVKLTDIKYTLPTPDTIP